MTFKEDFKPTKVYNKLVNDVCYNADCLEEFEKQRENALNAFIDRAKEKNRHRHEGLMFQINSKCRNPETPIKNCIEISKMMWDSFHDLQNAVSDPLSSQDQITKQRTATILEFKPKSENPCDIS